jgi:uncharacterized protein YlxW (UPF0749 family)
MLSERRLRAAEPKETPPQKKRLNTWQYFTGGLKQMANGEEKAASNIPFPVFAWLMGITIAAVYAFASLNATVTAINSAMLMRDSQMAREREEDRKRYAEEQQKLDAKISEQQAYINQLRVENARVRGK